MTRNHNGFAVLRKDHQWYTAGAARQATQVPPYNVLKYGKGVGKWKKKEALN